MAKADQRQAIMAAIATADAGHLRAVLAYMLDDDNLDRMAEAFMWVTGDPV